MTYLFLIVLLGQSLPSQAWIHPALWWTQCDLDRMRENYKTGIAPYKATGDALIAATNKNSSSQALDTIGSEDLNCQIGGYAILKMALSWVLTGDISYGNAARDKINEWSKYRTGGNCLRNGVGMGFIVNAADIIANANVNG